MFPWGTSSLSPRLHGELGHRLKGAGAAKKGLFGTPPPSGAAQTQVKKSSSISARRLGSSEPLSRDAGLHPQPQNSTEVP